MEDAGIQLGKLGQEKATYVLDCRHAQHAAATLGHRSSLSKYHRVHVADESLQPDRIELRTQHGTARATKPSSVWADS